MTARTHPLQPPTYLPTYLPRQSTVHSASPSGIEARRARESARLVAVRHLQNWRPSISAVRRRRSATDQHDPTTTGGGPRSRAPTICDWASAGPLRPTWASSPISPRARSRQSRVRVLRSRPRPRLPPAVGCPQPVWPGCALLCCAVLCCAVGPGYLCVSCCMRRANMQAFSARLPRLLQAPRLRQCLCRAARLLCPEAAGRARVSTSRATGRVRRWGSWDRAGRPPCGSRRG